MDLGFDAIEHITKVDPAKPLPTDLSILEATDLVMVGGSDDVTAENTLAAIESISSAIPSLPIWQEPYSGTHVTSETIEAVDYLAIPAVFNGDRDHFLGKHLDLFTNIAEKPDTLFGSSLPVVGKYITDKGVDVVSNIANKIIGEGYVVQHVDSSAALVSGARKKYTTEQVAGAALATETFYRFPVFYIEYSGSFGGPDDVEAAARYLDETMLLYGGGIDSASKTQTIMDAGADAIVVGDIFHDDVDQYLDTIPSA